MLVVADAEPPADALVLELVVDLGDIKFPFPAVLCVVATGPVFTFAEDICLSLRPDNCDR